jgi:hypothetical protein
MDEERRPLRVAAAGWVLTVLGCLVAVPLAAGARTVADPTTILTVGGVLTALLLTSGIGLIFGRRWAWPPAVVLGLIILAGAARMPGRPADLGGGPPFLILSITPIVFGFALVGCLLTPRSFKWLWADGADRT